MSDDTLHDDLRELEGLPPEDPRVQALGPAARAYLRAREDFVTGGETPAGARVHEAERRLGEALERELGMKLGGDEGATFAPAGGAGGVRPAGGFLDALFGPRLRPAFAVALVVIVAGGVWLVTSGRREPGPTIMRGAEPVTPGVALTTAARTLDDGALRLEWTPSSDADHYALVFLSPDLTELARVADLREPHVDLRSGALPAGLTPGSHALWRVIAMRGADEVARSRTAAITIP